MIGRIESAAIVQPMYELPVTANEANAGVCAVTFATEDRLRFPVQDPDFHAARLLVLSPEAVAGRLEGVAVFVQARLALVQKLLAAANQAGDTTAPLALGKVQAATLHTDLRMFSEVGIRQAANVIWLPNDDALTYDQRLAKLTLAKEFAGLLIAKLDGVRQDPSGQ